MRNSMILLVCTIVLICSGSALVFPAGAAPGDITTVAGGGVGDGGLATEASLSFPSSVSMDGSGNLYIAEGASRGRIRKVDTSSGIITTVAGTGEFGSSGDGGPATDANVSPTSVSLDASGSLYIIDSGSVRKVDGESGIITTLAGGWATAVAVDEAGNLYISDSQNRRIRKVDASGIISTVAGGGVAFPGDGGPATETRLNPDCVSVDGHGNLDILGSP